MCARPVGDNTAAIAATTAAIAAAVSPAAHIGCLAATGGCSSSSCIDACISVGAAAAGGIVGVAVTVVLDQHASLAVSKVSAHLLN